MLKNQLFTLISV